MPALKRSRALLTLFLLIALGVFLLLLPERHPELSFFLNIYDVEREGLLYSYPVEPGQEVLLSYRHSSDGTPVGQLFRIREDGLLQLMEERYAWYGAGLEFGSGYDFSFAVDQVHVKGYNRTFDSLYLRVARTVPQVLEFSGRKVFLSDLAPGGTRLLLKVESGLLIQY